MKANSRSDQPSFSHWRFARNVTLKALVLFVLVNLIFAGANPLPALGQVSGYNYLFPGRERLPYGDHPDRAYNLNLFNLEAMFASHELSAGLKQAGEYRVLLIGDSSTWGFLLPSGQTLAAQLNSAAYVLPDGRRLRAYNLGYPVMSLTKDLLILSYAMRYQPDLIVWPLTLESFPYDKQLFPPILQQNPEAVRALIEQFHLKLDPADPQLAAPSFWDRTLIGQRRNLADLARLQMYGPLWAATGIDQDIPATYTPRQEDLPADASFHNLQPPHLTDADLAFDVLKAGISMAGKTPVLFINEPMFISHGKNSDLRYNFFYPRWAYDDYRKLLSEQSAANGWRYVDLWQAADNSEFTNSAVHLTPRGESQFAQQVGKAILTTAR
ncbi:MAG TPA: hypothetical protein VF823_07820 [Anaerolineales bacterium]